MIYSKQIERKSKKERLTVDEMAMADLMCLGYADTDAYLITHQDQKIYGEDYIRKQIAGIVSASEFMKYSDRRLRSMKRDSTRIIHEEEAWTGELPDKESVAREIWNIANSLPVGSKERAEVVTKYADLMQMKKDSVEEEDVVHYYLPLTCNKCTLYNKK
jgi:hypothetical protein